MISIVLPAKNEAAALQGVLPRLRAARPDDEIIVVDDGSTDETRELCAVNDVRCLSSPYSMGNGAAIKRGARAASGEVLVFMDADGQHDPAHIDRLLKRMEQGYDMVVGARDWSGQAGVGRGVAIGGQQQQRRQSYACKFAHEIPPLRVRRRHRFMPPPAIVVPVLRRDFSST